MKSNKLIAVILLMVLHRSCSHSNNNNLNNKVPLYRLYRASSDNHFYTTSADEANNAVSKLGYNREGTIGLVSSTPGNCQLKPVYRLHKSNPKEDHFFTISESEATTAKSTLGYTKEGIAFYCSEKTNNCGASVGVYRYLRGSEHFYTTDIAEGHKVVQDGAKFEGIMCYIWK